MAPLFFLIIYFLASDWFWCVQMWISSSLSNWDLLVFLDVYANTFLHIKIILANCFFQIFLLTHSFSLFFPSGTHIMLSVYKQVYVDTLEYGSQVSVALFIFPLLFFSFYFSSWIISINLSSGILIFCLLKYLEALWWFFFFFFSGNVLFSYRIYIWYFKKMSVISLIFFTW